MRRPTTLSAFFTMICLVGVSNLSAAEAIRWNADINAAARQAASEQRPMLIFVSSQHCPYCTKMKRDTYRNAAVANDVNTAFIPVAVDADRSGRLVRQLRVSAYPTTLVVSPDAHVVDRIEGYVRPRQFRHRLATVLHQNHYAEAR